MTDFEKMNKLIKILKMDRAYCLQCMCRAAEDKITRYSTTLTYLDSLIARIDVGLESNELIEMIKVDRHYYQQCMLRAAEYDSGDMVILHYSNILKYISSLITQIEIGSK